MLQTDRQIRISAFIQKNENENEGEREEGKKIKFSCRLMRKKSV
jgi:hypothetical protein